MQAFQVFARVRPLSSKEQGLGECIHTVGQGCLAVGDEGRQAMFQLDEVFDETASNQQVFKGVVQSLLQSFLSGINSTVLAYGITGAGKSYTMFGGFDRPGIINLALNHLFGKEGVRLGLSYMEIYNQQVFDLLATTSHSLAIQDDPVLGVTVAELEEVQVWSAQQALQLIAQGNQRRVIAQTRANEFSSRSHAIVQLTMVRQTKTNTVLTSKLSLVDLAGSQRQNAYAEGRGLRNMQGSNINRSLLTLGNCITSLSEKKRGFVPYRDSKLTRLLKDSLGGNTRTAMVACISPSSITQDETLNTLKYATRARKIERIVTANTRQPSIKQLQKEVIHLREQLNQRASIDRAQMQRLITALISVTEQITELKLAVDKNLKEEMKQENLIEQRRELVSQLLGFKCPEVIEPLQPLQQQNYLPSSIQTTLNEEHMVGKWERLQDYREKYRQAKRTLFKGLLQYQQSYGQCESRMHTVRQDILKTLPILNGYLSAYQQEMVNKVEHGKALSHDELNSNHQSNNLFAIEKPTDKKSRFAGSLEQVRQMRQAINEKIVFQQQRQNSFNEVSVQY